MSQQKTGLSKGLIIGLSILAIIIMIVVMFITSITSMYNSAVTMENDVTRVGQDSQTELSKHVMKIRELAQVPEIYIDGLTKVTRESMQGRYGEDGSKAVMQWIQEQNLQVDSNVYLNIQAEISAGRNAFTQSQQRMNEVCRNYKNMLDYLFTGNVVRVMGFPRIDLATVCRPVTDGHTAEAFATGMQQPVNLRGN